MGDWVLTFCVITCPAKEVGPRVLQQLFLAASSTVFSISWRRITPKAS